MHNFRESVRNLEFMTLALISVRYTNLFINIALNHSGT